MLRIGLVGVGFMGWIHYLAYERLSSTCKLAAIVTRDEKKRSGDWTGIQGNFGPPGRQVDLSGVKTYATLDEALADPEIDLVDLCLPPNLHVSSTLAALKAGKHVFCEKPLALTAADCEKLVDAAKASGKRLFVGHVLPFFPEYAFALAAARDGRFGKVLGGSFKRVISDPLWLKDFYDPQGAGGPLIDLHVHDAHFIRLLFGMPRSVLSKGRLRGEVVSYCQTFFDYGAGGPVVQASSGVVDQQGRPFTHGYEIHFEKATLQFEFAVLADENETMGMKVLHADGSIERPKFGGGDEVSSFEAEIREVERALAAADASPILDGDLARDAVKLCEAQTVSVRENRAVDIR
jgi:predicted dehydrogenase